MAKTKSNKPKLGDILYVAEGYKTKGDLLPAEKVMSGRCFKIVHEEDLDKPTNYHLHIPLIQFEDFEGYEHEYTKGAKVAEEGGDPVVHLVSTAAFLNKEDAEALITI